MWRSTCCPRCRKGGRFAGSVGDGRFASVDIRDLADVAVLCFSAPEAHSGQTYVLTEELATEPGVSRLLSEASGRPMPYEHGTVEAHRQRIAQLGIKPDSANDLLMRDQEKREEWVAFMTPDLERLVGRKGRSLRDYIAELAVAGAFRGLGEGQ